MSDRSIARCLLAAGLLLPAAAALAAPTSGSYLAIGDSIVFGENPFIPHDDPSAFPSYPQDLAARLGLGLENLGCPGESTDSALDKAKLGNGCWARSGDTVAHARKLHVSYEVSQIDFAVAYLKAHPETRLVTVGLGSNDLLLAKKACENSMVEILCKAGKIPGVLWNVRQDMGEIVRRLRSVYKGRIVVANVYALDYGNFIDNLAISWVNGQISSVADGDSEVVIADVYAAFKKAVDTGHSTHGDSCTAGLLIDKGDGTCDVHPSAVGRSIYVGTVEAAAKTVR